MQIHQDCNQSRTNTWMMHVFLWKRYVSVFVNDILINLSVCFRHAYEGLIETFCSCANTRQWRANMDKMIFASVQWAGTLRLCALYPCPKDEVCQLKFNSKRFYRLNCQRSASQCYCFSFHINPFTWKSNHCWSIGLCFYTDIHRSGNFFIFSIVIVGLCNKCIGIISFNKQIESQNSILEKYFIYCKNICRSNDGSFQPSNLQIEHKRPFEMLILAILIKPSNE